MEFIALKGENLNTTVYRGFATIADLSKISAPDTFNQDNNPEGLQRDLSAKHSREGYIYAEGSRVVPDHPRLWPEVILNVRDPSIVTIKPIDSNANLWRVIVHEERLDRQLARPQISRTDGNHRLFFGNGDPETDLDPLDIPTPFSMTIGLTPEQEACLFIDINDNQKTMNTSHLYHLRARLTEPERLAADDPSLWIARRLAEDPRSPFHGTVYLGGERTPGMSRRINLAALRTGAEMILRESVKLRAFTDVETKYVLIRTHWNAVATVYSTEWSNPKDYNLLRGIGIWTLSMLGAEIIDRCLTRVVPPERLHDEMVNYLKQTKLIVDWDIANGNVSGYGGRSGAKDLAEKMKRSLSDEQVDMSRIAKALAKEL